MKKIASYIVLLFSLLFYSCKEQNTDLFNGIFFTGTNTTNSTTLRIGDSYQGGKIAYILQPGDPGYIAGQTQGLIAAPSDQSTGVEWGCFGTITGAVGTAIGKGNQNTIDIMAGCSTLGIPARLCGDLVLGGYSDWFLPSKEELNKLYINKAAIGGFANNYYWSSSEITGDIAWFKNFTGGSEVSLVKNLKGFVRAVRSFVALPASSGTVTDIEGNVYNTVTIGTQTWMKENLKTTKYRNGSTIPNVTDNTAWTTQTVGAYCWYNNAIANKATYGALYNFYTVVNSRNLCPTGWHVPTDIEWKTLEVYLGMPQAQADATGWRGTDQGTQLKSTTGWSNNGNGTNTSGFSALPGGYRYGPTSIFYYASDRSSWWSATEYAASYAWDRSISYDDGKVGRPASGYGDKTDGSSVRCIKD